MATQGMARGQVRMIEIFRWAMSHADFLHNAARANILRNGKGHERVKPEPVKSIVHHPAGSFRGKPFIPVACCETPANLYARCKGGSEIRHRQTDISDENVSCGQLRSVQA